MGTTSYSSENRSTRLSKMSTSNAYFLNNMSLEDALVDPVYKNIATNIYFENTTKYKMDPSMDPKNTVRECRDSDAHPMVIPVLLGLDVTGSMLDLPRLIVAQELDTLMSKSAQRGLDLAILFTAIGDLERDKYPFQIGQFESGDEELDLWLSKTYLEGNGGANTGESYHLLWLYAINNIHTDYEQKHGKKPLIFTFGDEPVLQTVEMFRAQELFGNDSEVINVFKGKKTITNEEILEAVKQKFDVYHFHIQHRYKTDASLEKGWRKLLGSNFYVLGSHRDIVPTLLNIIESKVSNNKESVKPVLEKESVNNYDWLDNL